MKVLARTIGGMAAVFVFFGLLGSSSLAQTLRGPVYQWGTEKTLTGTIKEVQTTQGRRPGMVGVHLVVDTKDGAFTAMVGPYQALQSQGYEPKEGDQVELLGSVLKINDQNVIIVKTLKASGKTVELRDAQGFPLWMRGPRMGGRPGAWGPQPSAPVAPSSK
jgi:hypothetical protein